MVTISYHFASISHSLANVETDGQQWQPAIASNPAGTRYVGLWTSSSGGDSGVAGRAFSAGGAPLAGEFSASEPMPLTQDEPSIAALADGRFVVTYTDRLTDPGGDIRGRFLDADGRPGPFFAVAAVTDPDHDQSDVAALADGGFVVTRTRHNGGGDNNVSATMFNADGSIRYALAAVTPGLNDSSHASVAGLAGGGFVVVWEESPAGGGDTQVRLRRYTADGLAQNFPSALIDDIGAINRDIQVAALPDGGFVVAYEDSGWGNGTDITARIFNADGDARTNFLHVNGAANGGVQVGDQTNPTLAVLPSGMFVVGWTGGNGSRMQAYDSSGAALGENDSGHGFVAENELVALAGGRFADVWQSKATDGSGDAIRTKIHLLVRRIEGDASSETIKGVGDGLTEFLEGRDGNDTLEGGEGADILVGGDGFDHASYVSAPTGVTACLAQPEFNTGHAAGDTYAGIEGLVGSGFDDVLVGNGSHNDIAGLDGSDVITGGLGNDTIAGGLGDDTAAFLNSLGQYTLQDFGSLVLVTGPDGTDTLSTIEHLRFIDTTLDVVPDGNPLFDRLYYYSRNTDVYFAGADALDHFDTFGRHEGRDPNALFDTSGYLAVNGDVAASGVNPLDHYHQAGWQQGRDPGAQFDTTLYLIGNPDVAAAGVDPLAHYLQFGFAEGRKACVAIGQNIVGGFDAQHYLLHNPDVAAAGVDALAHFNTFGWHEGRNPNGWFDSAGYLAHYADVAASGANPLDHYMAFGWQEGRDPSAAFDTLGYLAANPDVAAGGVNPLAHFLTFGIYEGRAAVNDGLWH